MAILPRCNAEGVRLMSFFEAEEKVFSSFILGNAPLKKLTDGFDWAEGPVWFGDHDCLLFSDIPNNRMLRWSPTSGLTTFREPANFSNGNTRDREGRLVTCEHGTRRVTRTEYDGSITVIADRYEGKPLNSPNDVIVASDGAIWFTDPHYGIVSDYEGTRSQQELPCNVYRVDPLSGAVHAVLTDFHCPNGLASVRTKDGSMSPIPGASTAMIRVISVLSMSARIGISPAAMSSTLSRRVARMGCGSMRTAISGLRRATVCIASPRTAAALGKSSCRRSFPMSVSADGTVIAFSSPPPRRSMPCHWSCVARAGANEETNIGRGMEGARKI